MINISNSIRLVLRNVPGIKATLDDCVYGVELKGGEMLSLEFQDGCRAIEQLIRDGKVTPNDARLVISSLDRLKSRISFRNDDNGAAFESLIKSAYRMVESCTSNKGDTMGTFPVTRATHEFIEKMGSESSSHSVTREKGALFTVKTKDGDLRYFVSSYENPDMN